ncbi:MAG: Sec-independent protein translocase subunit TatA/TatB [Actinomycetota bacterium]
MLDSLLAPDKLLLIAVVGLILFGPKRLPQMGRSIGRWLGEFRSAAGGLHEELKAGMNEPQTATAAEPAKAVETTVEPAKPAPAPAPPAE